MGFIKVRYRDREGVHRHKLERGHIYYTNILNLSTAQKLVPVAYVMFIFTTLVEITKNEVYACKWRTGLHEFNQLHGTIGALLMVVFPQGCFTPCLASPPDPEVCRCLGGRCRLRNIRPRASANDVCWVDSGQSGTKTLLKFLLIASTVINELQLWFSPMTTICSNFLLNLFSIKHRAVNKSPIQNSCAEFGWLGQATFHLLPRGT